MEIKTDKLITSFKQVKVYLFQWKVSLSQLKITLQLFSGVFMAHSVNSSDINMPNCFTANFQAFFHQPKQALSSYIHLILKVISWADYSAAAITENTMMQHAHVIVIVQGFTSPPTQYRLYGRQFLQVKRPNQQYQSTEGTHRLHN